MGMSLDKIVPWGRSYDEYVTMFDLTKNDLQLRILGCADGPASFNAILTKRNGLIVSVDPIYRFDAAQIRDRIAETYPLVMSQVIENQSDYAWEAIPSVEELGRIRMSAMDDFLKDYEAGRKDGRYVTAELPTLPFEDGAFDLALSSHFLFLYSAHLSAAFHLQSLQEMLRIANEIRVFPIVTLDGKLSHHLPSILKTLRLAGFIVEIKQVSYEFQRGGNEMLVIKHGRGLNL